nr:hypothetical protein [Cupriavidus gilardii]
MSTPKTTQTDFALAIKDGASVANVVEHLEQQLRGTDLEPEWLLPANFIGDANEAMFGPKPTRPWPQERDSQERFAVSICRGNSEGWIVHVDHIGYVGGMATVQKLIVCKCLARRHACQVAEAITMMLDLA